MAYSQTNSKNECDAEFFRNASQAFFAQAPQVRFSDSADSTGEAPLKVILESYCRMTADGGYEVVRRVQQGPHCYLEVEFKPAPPVRAEEPVPPKEEPAPPKKKKAAAPAPKSSSNGTAAPSSSGMRTRSQRNQNAGAMDMDD